MGKQFPKTWKVGSEYHTPGKEMLGLDIDTTEVVITVDGLLVSHTAIYDLDAKMSHFDVTSEFSAELGRELARAFDLNVMRSIVLAARQPADGPFPSGNFIKDASLVATTSADGEDWIDAIKAANALMFDKDVPEDLPRYMLVTKAVFDAIKYATDENGHHLVLNRDTNVGGAGGSIERRLQSIEVEGVTIFPTRTLPKTDQRTDQKVFPKYRADYSKTTGIMWAPPAVGTVKLIGMGLETERDTRRQEDFMVAKMAVGHGHLRQECAVEFCIDDPA